MSLLSVVPSVALGLTYGYEGPLKSNFSLQYGRLRPREHPAGASSGGYKMSDVHHSQTLTHHAEDTPACPGNADHRHKQ